MGSFWDRVDKVNSQKQQNKQKETASFWNRVDKINSGATKVGSKLNNTQVEEWFKNINSVGQRASVYLNRDGYRKPNSDFVTEIDKYLESSGDVEQYLRANKAGIKDYDNVMKSYFDTVNSLKSLRGSLDSYNKYFSQYATEDDYIWKSGETADVRQQRYKDNQTKISELEDLYDQAYSIETWYNSYRMNPNAWDQDTAKKNMDIYNRLKQYGSLDDLKKEIDRIAVENTNYERGNNGYVSKVVDDYDDYREFSGFDKISANRNYDNPTRDELTEYDSLNDSSSWYFDANGVYRDAYGNQLATDASGNWVNPNAQDDKYKIVDRLGMYLNASDRDILDATGTSVGTEGTWASVLKDGVDGSWGKLTENEIAIYYYLLNSSGQETADKYLSDMKVELNRRETTESVQNYVKAFDDASFLEKIALNLATVPAQLVSGVAGTIQNAADTLSGKDINPYSQAYGGLHFSNTIRGEQAAEFDKTGIKIPGLNFTLGDAYQSGMSILDSFASIGIGGRLGGMLLASSAATSEAQRLYEQGASREQIAWGSASAGLAEMVFESIGIDNLLKIKDVDTLGGMVMNILKQAGTEGLEEVGTEIANTVTNAIIMGTQSDWQNLLDENGGDVKGALLSKVIDVINAGIGGMISGTGTGIGGSVSSYASTAAQQYDTGKTVLDSYGGVDALKRLANDVAGVSDTKMKNEITKQASKVTSETATGKGVGKVVASIKNISNAKNVGRLYSTVEKANNLANASANQADITKSLVRKGINAETANDIAEAVVAKYNGQELTKRQERLLESASDIKAVQETIANVVANPESTMGQRRDNIHDFQKDVVNGIITKTIAENASEGTYEVSADGKTISKSTGEDIVIKGIASIENGKLVLETEDGTIDASDVAYASQDDALVYEAVANMGGIIDVNAANKLVQGFSKANVPASVYARGAVQAYTYGYYGYSMADAMGKTTMSAELTEAQRNTAFGLGRMNRKADAENAQANRAKYKEAFEKASKGGKKGGVFFRNNKMETSDIDSYLKTSGTELKDVQKVSIETMKNLSEALGVEFFVYESYEKNGKRYYIDENGVEVEGAPNGWYDTKTGRVYIDLHAGVNGRGTMLFTIAHELTHFIHQWSPEKFKVLADIIFTHGKMKGQVSGLVETKMANAKKRGKPISYAVAYEEVVADGMESILTSGRVMEMVADVKQQDRGLWQKICDWFKDLADYLKRVVDAYRGVNPDSVEGNMVASMKDLIKDIEAIYAEGLVDASENYQSFMEMAETTEIMEVGSGTLHSYSSLAEAAGFTAVENADGTRSFTREGSKVTEVTVDDIENSPIGALINFSLEKKDISKADADRQKKMFAEICTMACQTNDFAMTMQFVGSAVFTGMKANADKQYGTTYDFPSICTKTQAVIDAMSAKMVKLGRGLKSDEIVELYREVFASGNPVPCPECYVFSRWIGIGGLLDNIKKYQDYYGSMSVEDVAKAYLKMKAEVSQFAEEQGISFGKAKGALTSKLTKEFNKLTEKIEKAQNQGEKVRPADTKRLAELEPMMNTVKGMTWLENVYFADSSLKKVNPKFRVPNEVLFDLNNGEAFATQYKEAWAFRTTQGAGYGKAITPYAEARLGEGILVTNNTTNAIKGKAQGSLDNYFLKQKGALDKKSKDALNKARLKQKIQAFIGGQRFQSTSDARFENASDYLLAALEMQAMAGMVQVYTKVDGAVPAFSAWGFSINQSLMPLGGGLDENGNVKDTSVGGMAPKVAFENRDNHESAGTITIGVNDNHIRAMFKQWVRDFIIPYHASGGKAEVVSAFRSIQEGQEKRGQMVRSTDYSRTQSDKVLSDEVLSWQGKTAEEIKRIHDIRDARIAILTGGKPNMDVVRNNRFLSALYDKLHGGEWDGVKLAKSKVESQIFPNEFWDQTVSYENSGKITRDYLEYCDDLGFLHRFSGMVPSNGRLVPVNGYDQNGEKVQLTDLAYKYENGQKTDQVEEFFWKVLTDRRMYDNEGNYLPQKVVTLNDTTTDTVTGFAKNNFGRQYNKEVSEALVNKILYSDRISELTEEDVYRLIENSNHGEYALDSFIPVRRDTPPLLVELSKKDGLVPVKNLPIIMNVEHVQQCMDEEVTANDGKRGHALTTDNIIEIIKGLDDPRYVFFQEDNKRYCEVVEYDVGNRGEKSMAIVTYTGNKNPDLMNGFPGREYNILVTAYHPDAKYWRDYQKSSNNRLIYDKTKDAPQGSYGSHVPSLLSGSPFAITVTQPDTEVKRFSDRDSDYPTTDPDIRYQNRTEDSVSNRSLLANALEGAAKNDIEKQKIQEYKGKISLINAEERKLTELNEKIKELSFAKGPRDTKAIRDLQVEAKQTANRINTYDKQLLRLEASQPLQNVLSREKKMAYDRAKKKGDEALAAYREKASKAQREMLERWQASRKKGIESRQKTAMRHKIKDIVNELNQYLLKGTKDRHVPIGLQKAVAEALNAVNMDTVGAEQRIAKLNEELLKAKTPEAIQEISKRIDNVREMGERMDEKLKKLKTAYDEFLNSDDPMIANAHDDGMSAHMMTLIVRVGDTPLRDMSVDQLQDVYDVYKIVLATIRNANKSFKDNKNREISTRANQVMAEIDGLGVKRGKRIAGTEWLEQFGWDGLKPVYAMEHIGSKTLTDAFNNVRAGEDTWAKDIVEAKEFYLERFKKYKYDSWDFEKKRKFTSTTGMDFELTLDQIMSLYAFSKREQAADHLKYGGIVFDPKTEVVEKTKSGLKVKYNVANATSYNISEETLGEIVSKLTDDQKSFVDEMQAYLSDVMGAKGNEVSLAMYDVKLFREKNYFPLKSATQYMAKAKEQAQGEVKIKNSGFSNETKPHAKNPIVLSSFMDVWTNHVNDMSMYHAFVLPMEDFYRIYNYTTPSNNENMPVEGVNPAIENAFGSAATGYIEQMLKDLNGGARNDQRAGLMNKMMGLFKKGAVFASLSVVVQQPSAIARAAALVDTKYFIGPKVDGKRHKALWDEVKKYAPVAIIKEMGYFDTNMGKSTQDFITSKEYSGFKEKMTALVKDSNYRDEILSKAPALADELAWCSIWEAVKRETNAKYPGLDVNSEPFLMLAGSRFTEVITKTQVYDSVLSRSALMRSKDTGMKMATSFMAEPTTSINMIADALLKGKRGDKRYARAAIGAVIASQIINSILVSFVYAGRDDDEDETYAEKYIGTLTGEILDSMNPLTYIPFIKDIVSIVQGYDVERSDMAIISDLWKAWENLSKDTVSAYRKVESFVGSVAQIFGLPVKNIMRDVRGIYQTIDSFVNGQKTTALGIGYAIKGAVTGKDVSDQQQLYDAYLRGDTTHIARVESRYKNQTAINTALRKALRENDPRIKEAAEAKFNGNLSEYTRIARQIIADGRFSQDNVVAAINAEINAMDKAGIDVESSWFDKYYEDVADSGIEIDTYMEYRNAVRNITGDGKKEKRMAVIDSMPITSAQKDALYYAEGWAASTLDEAPWH